jgi:hypothetical protein
MFHQRGQQRPGQSQWPNIGRHKRRVRGHRWSRTTEQKRRWLPAQPKHMLRPEHGFSLNPCQNGQFLQNFQPAH